MKAAWQLIKDHAPWVYLAVFLGLAAYSFALGDISAGIIQAVVAFGVFFLLLWAKSGRPVEVTLKALPPAPPTGGEERVDLTVVVPRPSPEWLAEHRKETPTCSLCKWNGWDDPDAAA